MTALLFDLGIYSITYIIFKHYWKNIVIVKRYLYSLSQPTNRVMYINDICKKSICRFLMLGNIDEDVSRDADCRACTDLYFYELQLRKEGGVLRA